MAALEEGEETICSGPGPGVLRLPTVEPETGTGGEDKDKGRGGGGARLTAAEPGDGWGVRPGTGGNVSEVGKTPG